MTRKTRNRSRPTVPLTELPKGYRLQDTFSITLAQPKLLIGLNLIGVVIFFAAGWWLLDSALRWRPELGNEIVRLSTSGEILFILANFAGLVIAIVLHELVHGLCFWWLTRDRPVFGFRLAYAFTAAPKWYLPRGPYLIVGLAPLITLTALGLVAIRYIPAPFIPALLFGLVTNIAGSVGDLAVAIWLLRKPAKLLAQDLGDSINVFW